MNEEVVSFVHAAILLASLTCKSRVLCTCCGLGYHKMDFIHGVIKGDQIFGISEWKGNQKRHIQLGEGIL